MWAFNYSTYRKYAVILLAGLFFQLPACSDEGNRSLQGYVEGEYLYLAAPQAGYLQSLNANRGSRVVRGQTVFIVSDSPDDQVLLEAQARAESARQKLQNLKQPKRPTEIAELEANLNEAKAHLRLTEIELKQQEQLAERHFTARINVDEARSAYRQALARVAAVNKQIATYENTVGRQAEIQAAEADFAAAQAEIEQKHWIVAHKTVTAPAVGEINETYYRPGEWVAAGAPVASLLPDDRRRLRFFVPEPILATIKLGDAVEASCDSCPRPIRGLVDFIAPEAEYTPPVIYSLGSREKLVFRVEAAPSAEQAQELRPGLPVDVRLVP
ncbi:HlyD family secretion protein [Methylomonas sp. MgM2]